MSFNVSQNIPDFATTARQAEDYIWQRTNSVLHSQSPSRHGHYRKDSDLPLYKDKPLSSQADSVQDFRRKLITLGVITGFILFFLYRSSGLFWFSTSSTEIWKTRQDLVRQTFLDSYLDYEAHAMGKDIYKPVSKQSRQMAPNGLGWIIVDCLDTMMIMKLDEPLARARAWVSDNLTYDQDYAVNTFETTIRMLGGFLSAHYLSNYDDLYLEKAVDLANRLLGAFDSPSGIPYASVNLRTLKGIKSHDDGGASSTAEVTSLQLEFKYLSKLTGETLYWEKAEKVMKVIDDNHAIDALVPIFIHPDTGKFRGQQIRLGSRGDSYYEYLLKQYLQTNNQENIYRQMYDESMTGLKKRLVEKSYPNGFTYIAELDSGINGPTTPKMDHLVCFLPGNLALGATGGYDLATAQRTLWTFRQAADLKLSKELIRTCYQMYAATKTGIAPEIVFFNKDPSMSEDIHVKFQDAHNLQRPETVESLFILWRITKDPIYREWGWTIFEAFRKYAVLSDGSYSSLENVDQIPPLSRDNMESFWLAETLKYFYLLFEDDDSILSLEQFVFNTEAHPFPKFNIEPLFKTGWSRD
ncbi:glycoside hydrolase [Lipomyces japonicus]|uniref:glycoside hydrolase n=1 Tax=Lipomyces japonicus TaxID=56871 RepID=UPI0034CE474B